MSDEGSVIRWRDLVVETSATMDEDMVAEMRIGGKEIVEDYGAEDLVASRLFFYYG